MAVEDKPSMISLQSHIGWPAGAMDTAKAHGSPLGADEISKTKEILSIPADQSFWVQSEVLAYRGSTEGGSRRGERWRAHLENLERRGSAPAWEAATGGAEQWAASKAAHLRTGWG